MPMNVSSPLLAAAALAAATLAATPSFAGGIPFAGNRPQSFEFPLDYTDTYHSFGQFLQITDDDRRFDADGNKRAGFGGHSVVGLSSALRYWKFDALPQVGWVGSITVPEVRIEGRGFTASGLGDPLVGGIAFVKPTPASTLGTQWLVQVPIGAAQVTTNTWSVWPSVFYNHWFGQRVNLDVLAGGVLRGATRKTGSNDLDAGNTFHLNLRLGVGTAPVDYTRSVHVVPFAGLDYQRTGKTRDKVTELDLADSDSRETAASLGVLFQIKTRGGYDQFELHYARGLKGRNTSVTDGLFLQFWHYF